MEAVKIKRKSTLAVVSILALALLINVTDVSAANSTFNTTSVVNSADTVRNYIETNNYTVPTTVTVNNQKVTSAQYLYLLTSTVGNINKSSKTPVTLKNVSNPTNPSETIISGTLTLSEYVSIANKITTFVNTNGRLPNYVATSLGQMRCENLIYTYSKILSFYKTNNRMPTTVAVKPWASLYTPTGGSGGLRPVYITSDIISNSAIDNARINSLVSALKSLGVSAFNYGTPGKLWLLLNDKSVPSNALIVEIAGGADAGSIKEKGGAWYQGLLGDKEDFIVFTDNAKKITGLAWLERAHDDNYSPASFTGLAHPDEYLLAHGVGYFEGLTTKNIAACAQAIYQAALS
jgi:hypothetical protein